MATTWKGMTDAQLRAIVPEGQFAAVRLLVNGGVRQVLTVTTLRLDAVELAERHDRGDVMVHDPVFSCVRFA